MTIEQTHLRYPYRKPRTLEIVPKHPLEEKLPAHVLNFVRKWVDLYHGHHTVILDTATRFNFSGLKPGIDPESGLKVENIINLRCLNNILDLNGFFVSTNENLESAGIFIGCVVTAQHRKERILSKYKAPFNWAFYFFDYLVRRVWPKLPVINHLYYKVVGCKNRAISEIETYGRLYACGFSLVDTLRTEDRLYYAVQKTGEPDRNENATYGPFIQLKRTGKNGKAINVYKLRTMYPYSEYLQQYMYEKCGLQDGGKLNKDPRVNALGAFLRKYWLDELPMLINLLKGDLKLFGVRPLSKQYMSLYPKDVQEYRRKFKPGLLPPFYADLPKQFDEIVASEVRYLQAYEQHPILTDLRYMLKVVSNIVFKSARSH